MSRTAKYYIYRNLNTGNFSIRYKGKVIAHEENIICMGVEFRVNEKGRQRVIDKQRKHVHAFIVCENYLVDTGRLVCAFGKYDVEVTYNPYEHEKFFRLDNGADIDYSVIAHCKDNKVYVR